MRKRQLWDWGFSRDSSVQDACDTSIARTIIIVAFHLADISIVILSFKGISRRILTVGRVQSQSLNKYQDPSLQEVHHAYSPLWCSHEQPFSLLCRRLRYLHTLDNSLFLYYDYWSVNMLGFCISTPIARCNRRVELSIDTYLVHQLVQRFSQYIG